MPKLRALLLPSLFVILALTIGAAAQDYPTKPVRILVPFPPGGINDLVARLIGAQLSERLGKQFVVENKTGAGGIIAGDTLVNAPKDGHTLMIVSMAIAVNPHMYKMTYDTLKDFAPIAILATAPNLLSVNAELPAKSIQEVIALAKAKPGDLKYASSGVGTFMHLGPELFKSMAGVDILHVPFRGAGPALIDVVAGNTQMSFASVPSTISHIRSGKLRGLGVGGLKRSFALPDVPTIDRVRRGGLSMRQLDRPGRADRHAAADHREAAQGADRGAGFAGAEKGVRARGCRRGAHEPGRVRRVHRQRNRQMGQGGARGRRQAAVTLSRSGRKRTSPLPLPRRRRAAPRSLPLCPLTPRGARPSAAAYFARRHLLF